MPRVWQMALTMLVLSLISEVAALSLSGVICCLRPPFRPDDPRQLARSKGGGLRADQGAAQGFTREAKGASVFTPVRGRGEGTPPCILLACSALPVAPQPPCAVRVGPQPACHGAWKR